MFRILGFILGSVVSIAGIVLLLGIPEFHLSSFESDQARFDAAIEKIKENQPDMQVLADSIVDKVEEIVADTPELPDEMLPETAVETALGPEPFQDSIVAAEYSLPLEMDSVDYEQQWHEFWNPFRSEIAARGFVSQLEKVTGLDYRIVKIKAGVYQVGFAYQDDNERLAKISQITAATGLEFPEL